MRSGTKWSQFLRVLPPIHLKTRTADEIVIVRE